MAEIYDTFGKRHAMPDKAPDMVNHPPHYNQGGIECVDAIEASMSPQGFRDYLKGNILKYLWRYEQKHGLEDLKKAQWYLTRLTLNLEEEKND